MRLTQAPVLGRALLWLHSILSITRHVLSIEKAFYDRHTLTPGLVDGYVRANLGDRHKRAKVRRYLAHQLDPPNQRCTLEAIERLRTFDRPTLLLWGTQDPHFGREWADKLYGDIPGVRGLELLEAGHMVMEERPEEFARIVSAFLARFSLPSRAALPAQPPTHDGRSDLHVPGPRHP